MNPEVVLHTGKAFRRIKYLPVISIVFPFQPAITKKDELQYRVMLLMQKIENDLLIHYDAEKAIPVLIRLKNLLNNLNYNSCNKSVAIFVSPVTEKIFYLDIEVKETVSLDDSFDMRNLASCKMQVPRYLVMVCNESSSQLYEGNCSGLSLIKSNNSDKELNVFLEEIDNGLTLILKFYPMPVVIVGTTAVLERFKKITINGHKIIKVIEVNDDINETSELPDIMLALEANWKNIKQQYFLRHILKASRQGKLFFGIDRVWNEVILNKGSLLIIEINYLNQTPAAKSHHYNSKNYFTANPFYIKDEIDQIIEKVFENKGDVEFVDDGQLKEYKQIALICS